MTAVMVERLSRLLLLTAFWVPLVLCTWLALSPSPPDTVFQISDVVLHAFAFTYLTFALGLAHPAARAHIMISCMLGYGLLIEVAQSFEPARSAELKDLLVDLAGILLGVAVLRLLGPWSRRRLRALLAGLLGPR